MSEVAEQLRLGDHAALFYRNRAEQFSFVIPYLKHGLDRNERCLYIADDNSVPMILKRLEEMGVDVDEARGTGALQVVTKHETYLRHGLFEPDKMIADLEKEVVASVKMGFAGFRASGEMTWALDLPSALKRMLEYEAKLHERFPAEFVAVCQYDETKFPEHIVRGMVELHPIVIRGGEVVRQVPSDSVVKNFSGAAAVTA